MSPGSSPAEATTDAPAEAPVISDPQSPPDQIVIDVVIEAGQVTPTNQQLRASVNEPIVVRVASDATDELHVHSTPEHTFAVGIGPAQTFQFTVEVPGRVDVELHTLHKTIATIQVQ